MNISKHIALFTVTQVLAGAATVYAGETVKLPLNEIIEKSRPSHGLQGNERRRERLDEADRQSDAPGQPEIFRQHSKKYQELDKQGRFIRD